MVLNSFSTVQLVVLGNGGMVPLNLVRALAARRRVPRLADSEFDSVADSLRVVFHRTYLRVGLPAEPSGGRPAIGASMLVGGSSHRAGVLAQERRPIWRLRVGELCVLRKPNPALRYDDRQPRN